MRKIRNSVLALTLTSTALIMVITGAWSTPLQAQPWCGTGYFRDCQSATLGACQYVCHCISLYGNWEYCAEWGDCGFGWTYIMFTEQYGYDDTQEVPGSAPCPVNWICDYAYTSDCRQAT